MALRDNSARQCPSILRTDLSLRQRRPVNVNGGRLTNQIPGNRVVVFCPLLWGNAAVERRAPLEIEALVNSGHSVRALAQQAPDRDAARRWPVVYATCPEVAPPSRLLQRHTSGSCCRLYWPPFTRCGAGHVTTPWMWCLVTLQLPLSPLGPGRGAVPPIHLRVPHPPSSARKSTP